MGIPLSANRCWRVADKIWVSLISWPMSEVWMGIYCLVINDLILKQYYNLITRISAGGLPIKMYALRGNLYVC